MKPILCNLAAVGCLLALFDLPSEFYKVLRFVVGAACVSIIFQIQKSDASEKVKTWTSVGFGLLTTIYNPVLPLNLERGAWFWANLIAATAFILNQNHRRLTASFATIKKRKSDPAHESLTTSEIIFAALFIISAFSFIGAVFLMKGRYSFFGGICVITFFVSTIGWTVTATIHSWLDKDKQSRIKKSREESQKLLTRIHRERDAELEYQNYLNTRDKKR